MNIEQWWTQNLKASHKLYALNHMTDKQKVSLKFLHQKYNDNTFWYSVIASNIQSWMMKNCWINISYIHCDCDDNMAFDKGS